MAVHDLPSAVFFLNAIVARRTCATGSVRLTYSTVDRSIAT
jgi:hypothetical protein